MNTIRKHAVALSTRQPVLSERRPAAAVPSGAGQPAPRANARPWTALVCLAFVAAQLALAVPGSGLGWDETVYTSQVSGHIPAAFFSAPRARGVSFLAAPVAAFTTSTPALRIYLAALSGAGLWLALRMWRDLLPERVRALAGALFAGLWITVFYGPQVMPNVWSAWPRWPPSAASCAPAGPHRPGRPGRPGRRGGRGRADAPAGRRLAGPAAGRRGAGGPRPARPALFAALAAGVLLGCAEWVVEAYVRYGGPAARLHRSSAVEGGMGLHLALDDQLRSLNGRSLCRPCDIPWHHRAASAWFLALPVLVAGGAAAVPRARRAATWLALLTALSMAAPYLFTISYAAPRFLLPAYALLAIPVAELLWWLVTRRSEGPAGGCGRSAPAGRGGAWRVHLAIQGSVLLTATGNNRRGPGVRHAGRRTARGRRTPAVRALGGLRGTARVLRGLRVPAAGRPRREHHPAGLRAAARHRPVAVLVAAGGRPPAFTGRLARAGPARPGGPRRPDHAARLPGAAEPVPPAAVLAARVQRPGGGDARDVAGDEVERDGRGVRRVAVRMVDQAWAGAAGLRAPGRRRSRTRRPRTG